MPNRRALAAALPLLLLLLPSCGKTEYGSVEGKITYQGQPLPDAVVFFIPERGPAAAGATLADGSYTMLTKRPGDGVLIGRCKVAITAVDPITKPLPIPEKYTDAETSGLTADIKDGQNILNFEIPGT